MLHDGIQKELMGVLEWSARQRHQMDANRKTEFREQPLETVLAGGILASVWISILHGHRHKRFQMVCRFR
jgi:hypothetical protein